MYSIRVHTHSHTHSHTHTHTHTVRIVLFMCTHLYFVVRQLKRHVVTVTRNNHCYDGKIAYTCCHGNNESHYLVTVLAETLKETQRDAFVLTCQSLNINLVCNIYLCSKTQIEILSRVQDAVDTSLTRATLFFVQTGCSSVASSLNDCAYLWPSRRLCWRVSSSSCPLHYSLSWPPVLAFTWEDTKMTRPTRTSTYFPRWGWMGTLCHFLASQ